MSKVELKGIDKIQRKLKDNLDLSDVSKVVKLNTSEMQANAQRLAPVDTGNLKRSVKISFENGGMTGIVASTAEYAPYQEYGTRYMAGTPHVGPSYRQQAPKFKNDLNRLFK